MGPIFLVGYMGCGKSTMGRKLAQRLSLPFFDTDSMIEQSEGALVADIFHYEGEERFRTLERNVLERIMEQQCACVVSTGGGLPVWSDNMEYINRLGCTIYLRRSPGQITRRLTPYGRRKRPKINGMSDEELLAFMEQNMALREPFYAKSQITVECGILSDAELIEILLLKIKNGGQ